MLPCPQAIQLACPRLIKRRRRKSVLLTAARQPWFNDCKSRRICAGCHGFRRPKGGGLVVKGQRGGRSDHQLPALPAIPYLGALSGRTTSTAVILHVEHSTLVQRLKRGVNLLSPPPFRSVWFLIESIKNHKTDRFQSARLNRHSSHPNHCSGELNEA